MKKIILPLVIFLFSSNLFPQNLAAIADSIKTSKGFEHSIYAMYARYTDTGEEILNSDGDKSVAPASNLKLFTTSAALNYLGEDFRFSTDIFYRGKISADGTLNGDLIIRGGGDPTLGYSAVKGSVDLDSLMQLWTDALKNAGIKQVMGYVIADENLFDRMPLPDYYPWIDMGNYYGASTSALTIHNNLYFLFFKPSEKPGGPAEVLRIEPPVKGLTFTNYMKTGEKGSGDNGYIYAAPKQFNAELRGTIPAGVPEFSIKGSIPDPALFTVQYFADYINTKGINVSGIPFVNSTQINYDFCKKIHSTLSPPLKDIVYIINKKSDNLYTEQLLKMTGWKVFGEGSTDKGIDAIRKFLAEINVSDTGLTLYDGSGLSRTNFITPQIMCKMLSAVTQKPFFGAFNNSLGLAGDPNDPSSFKTFGAGTPIALNTRIKSGTINGVHGHSGYIKTKSGRLVAFSFIANNFEASDRRVNEANIRLLTEIAEKY